MESLTEVPEDGTFNKRKMEILWTKIFQKMTPDIGLRGKDDVLVGALITTALESRHCSLSRTTSKKDSCDLRGLPT